MPRFMKRRPNPEREQGSAVFLAPVVALIMVYLAGFFVDLGDAMTKANGLDQAVSLSAAAASTKISRSAFYGKGLLVLDPQASQLLHKPGHECQGFGGSRPGKQEIREAPLGGVVELTNPEFQRLSSEQARKLRFQLELREKRRLRHPHSLVQHAPSH